MRENTLTARTSAARPLLATVTALVIGGASGASAAVIVTEGLGTPAFADFQTFVVTDGQAVRNQERTLRAESGVPRNPAQSFQLDSPIEVGSLHIHYTSTGVTNRSFVINFYEVDDVTAASHTLGVPLKAVPVTTSLTATSGTDNFFRVDFTGTDVFTLAARNNESQGYLLEMVSDTNNSQIFNWQGNNANVYPDGRAYNSATSGGGSGDWNFALANIPEPSTALLGAIGALGLLRRRR